MIAAVYQEHARATGMSKAAPGARHSLPWRQSELEYGGGYPERSKRSRREGEKKRGSQGVLVGASREAGKARSCGIVSNGAAAVAEREATMALMLGLPGRTSTRSRRRGSTVILPDKLVWLRVVSGRDGGWT